ncbi:NrfD/PsrC family molybdoenzyme membrane anchor subunit [Adlercreutzia sp. R25]|uniref:NrfD/PsrC family molybdoenzyme membrane anchor subunit n=1 Tax=Adlercreutzia shanghongiae TaxID=3111773 RepID=A0ABU6J119_9ACTN|nr:MULTISPECIES: NrfD/PsrC family molybdoenzyme membrane anchor subunit [unclassified Adlercreutzia]MEC4271607.1 NrfD/PsrC family molybdoenzyme membrane anchor subunit [Adlercreutzia sp. R25]MEC4295754.1 NrfD/PsrC family molybdoenzyme membrane anchor subunit [Adlercreutzia sp. R22]
MLGTFVVLYLLLGGCGAAVLGLAALWSLLFSRTCTRTGAQSRAFALLRARLFLVSFAILVLAALCLLLDLGRPARVLLLFVRPTTSLISLGTFVLAACLVLSAFLAAANMLDSMRVSSRIRKVAEVLSLIPAVVMLVYTGLYMAWMEAVPLWNNPALPWLLAASSLSSGVALIMLIAPFSRDWKLLTGWLDALRRMHQMILVVELVALIAFCILAAMSPFAVVFLADLFDPIALGPWFVVGFIVLGLVLPLAAEFLVKSLRGSAGPKLAEVLCISGGLILRFCLVLAGSHWLG